MQPLMRIFYISQRVPFPPNRGDKIATFHHIRHLARHHEVHVFCIAADDTDAANIAGLDDIAASVTAITLSPRNARLRALKALAVGGSLSAAYFEEPRLHAAIASRHQEISPDLIVVYSSNVAQFAEPFAATPRIMYFSDLDSQKWAQYAERTLGPMRLVYALEARRLLAHERRTAYGFSHSVVSTSAELRDFQRLIPCAPVSAVRNGVDLERFRPSGRPKRPSSMVFTGIMDYLPNIDAVTWFADAILPRIREVHPEARLVICGANPTAAVRRLGRRDGITVTGVVADTRPYLEEAEVFVAPLRVARGIQNKLLEAMAIGLPCVTSRLCWSFTEIPEGEGVRAIDDPEAFAAEVVHLLEDRAYQSDMARRARRAVEQRYAWECQLAGLDRIITDIVGNASELAV